MGRETRDTVLLKMAVELREGLVPDLDHLKNLANAPAAIQGAGILHFVFIGNEYGVVDTHIMEMFCQGIAKAVAGARPHPRVVFANEGLHDLYAPIFAGAQVARNLSELVVVAGWAQDGHAA
ncbi:MAG TPA: hypothetical protein VJG64_04265 [Candidatus Paceibacterota bacterium]